MKDRPFRKLLVANRGEIACRIIRTAKRLGIATVAIHSEADSNAVFAQEADEKHLIGPASPRESYLAADRILEVAARSGAEAIHPGYGFLSENAGFARAVAQQGLTWVGPSPEAMEKLAAKLPSRALASAAEVPLIPGSGALGDVSAAQQEAARIGYPVLLKASAGGGGIGITVVESESKLERALDDAIKKGQNFFGDGTVYLEKLIEKPAHVEVQIFGDRRGQIVALGERDCTVQRRKQKVIEETPSPRLSPALRAEMLAAAIRIGQAAGYTNAGTVEMIVGETGDFYFLEVNSRLQVEHPITEMVTGLDLVEAQLWIAAGEPIGPALKGARAEGHAIEARLCAEDPDKRFFPSPGTIERFRVPVGVRVDAGYESGSVVSPYYDSLIAKLIVHAPDRPAAILAMKEAVARTILTGIKTNLSLFPKVLDSPAFQQGTHDTSLIFQLGYQT